MQDFCKKAVRFLVNVLISPITLVLSGILAINLIRKEIKKRKKEA
ncbi:MAG: hypothetical protein SPJ92_07145 [Bariatricus sp.]|nr:hypothetical protein [Bariatricus sp.]